MPGRLIVFFIAFTVLLVCGFVAAQERDECRQHKKVADSWFFDVPNEIENDLKLQFRTITKAVKKNGIEKARETRVSLFQKFGTATLTRSFNQKTLQSMIRARMTFDYCELIWSRPGWGDEKKTASLKRIEDEIESQAVVEILALRPMPQWPVAQKRNDEQEGFIRQISFEPTLSRMVAQNEPRFQMTADDPVGVDQVRSAQPLVPEGRSVYLRDPPFYVTKYNKYFVIVASPETEEKGLERLKELRAKAPQYDFALYPPFGSNTVHAIMMASWVPYSVARKAVEDAWRDVTPSPCDAHRKFSNPCDDPPNDPWKVKSERKNPAAAYLWKCKFLGERC